MGISGGMKGRLSLLHLRRVLQIELHENLEETVKVPTCSKEKCVHFMNLLDFLCFSISSSENILEECFEIAICKDR